MVKAIHDDMLKNKLLQNTFTNMNTALEPIAKRHQALEKLMFTLDMLLDEIKQNPNMTTKMYETIIETVITLKAMQKTWLLEDHVERKKKHE